MARGIDWELLDDLYAIKKGKELPVVAVARAERRRRVLSLLTDIVNLAGILQITTVDLAKELEINRSAFYRWLQGKDIPTMKNYRRLLQLCLRLHVQAKERLYFYL